MFCACHFFLLCFFRIIAAATPPYTPTDFILVNCGTSENLNDTNDRLWNGDVRSLYAPSNADAISSISTISQGDPSVSTVPFYTARFFRSHFTYSFPVSAGQKFLRLYFFPTSYSDFDASHSFFSLKANAFTLLSNFSAYLYSTSSSKSFIKEFVINIEANQRLELIFSPNTGSLAFINGIEIVSIPNKLYFRGNDVPIKFVDDIFYLNQNTALENVYRLKGGDSYVGIKDDTGMYRSWSSDEEYIYYGDLGWSLHRPNISIKYTPQTPPYTAPEIVYSSARVMNNYSRSLEWGFPVHSGFHYLLRFHYCEFTIDVTKQQQRVFTVSVDNQTLETIFDVIYAAGGPQIPIFEDYVVWVPDQTGGRAMHDLRLSMFPYAEANSKYKNVLLNGLEIFTLNDTKGSFAAPNPEPLLASPPPSPPPQAKKSGGSSIIYPVVGGVVGAAVVAAAVCFLILLSRRKVKDTTSNMTRSSWVPISTGSRTTARTSRSGTTLPSDLCRYFSINEIKTATRNFDEMFVVGRGGFGKVYKGLIDDAATSVAIKRLNPSSSQGAREFLTEIEMLSKLRHLHLVSLIGYCDEEGEMILVYDYMSHGTLRDHLYNTENPPLSWKQRLEICLGAAKGLEYLHTGAKLAIIHRDVKSTNILLDDKWVAKVSDFGLSKVGPAAGAQAHVSTVVKGSFGYVDPEYYRRQQLTLKSDVYSFGVVMFELLCARPPIIPSLPGKQVNLAEWAKFCFGKGTIEQIIDSNLKGQIAPECLSKFVETAIACLKEKGIDRPSMNDIIWSLEFAMQLQASSESSQASTDAIVATHASVPLLSGTSNTTDEDDDMLSRSKSSDFSTSSSEKLKSGDAFSELMNPSGR